MIRKADRNQKSICLFYYPKKEKSDMRSFISLHKENWRSHSYAAARCVGDQVLFQMLKANSNIDTVYLCMDNDVAGQAANKRISDKLFSKTNSAEFATTK